jgi:hypothetical protein
LPLVENNVFAVMQARDDKLRALFDFRQKPVFSKIYIFGTCQVRLMDNYLLSLMLEKKRALQERNMTIPPARKPVATMAATVKSPPARKVPPVAGNTALAQDNWEEF